MSISSFKAEVRARLSAATPGPWVPHGWRGSCHLNHYHDGHSCKYDYTPSNHEGSHHTISMANKPQSVVITTEEYGALSLANATLIANSPTDLTRLLAIVECYEAALKELARPVELNDSILFRPTDDMATAGEALASADKLAGGGADGP